MKACRGGADGRWLDRGMGAWRRQLTKPSQAKFEKVAKKQGRGRCDDFER